MTLWKIGVTIMAKIYQPYSRLGITLPITRKQEKTLVILRAIGDAKPGKEQKAVRKALKKFKRDHPKAA